MLELAFVTAGLVVGILVGMTGVGGGSIMTPLLMGGFGLPANIAVGTDLLYAGSTKLGATATHTRLGHVDWRMVVLLAAGSLPAAGIALATLATMKTDISSFKTVITTALGVALIGTAVALMLRDRLLAWIRRRQPAQAREAGAVPIVTIGAVLGALVALSSDRRGRARRARDQRAATALARHSRSRHRPRACASSGRFRGSRPHSVG